MSFIFSNYDRTDSCDHIGVLGRKSKDGTRMCMRCGTIIQPEIESFTAPVGRKSDRPAKRLSPR